MRRIRIHRVSSSFTVKYDTEKFNIFLDVKNPKNGEHIQFRLTPKMANWLCLALRAAADRAGEIW